MDTNHPTTKFLILVILPLFVMALLVVLSLWLSGDIYLLNCKDNCKIFNNIQPIINLYPIS